ncbi:hypothetical protein AMTRI_Chr03g45940 [Amborella trichopoda]
MCSCSCAHPCIACKKVTVWKSTCNCVILHLAHFLLMQISPSNSRQSKMIFLLGSIPTNPYSKTASKLNPKKACHFQIWIFQTPTPMFYIQQLSYLLPTYDPLALVYAKPNDVHIM